MDNNPEGSGSGSQNATCENPRNSSYNYGLWTMPRVREDRPCQRCGFCLPIPKRDVSEEDHSTQDAHNEKRARLNSPSESENARPSGQQSASLPDMPMDQDPLSSGEHNTAQGSAKSQSHADSDAHDDDQEDGPSMQQSDLLPDPPAIPKPLSSNEHNTAHGSEPPRPQIPDRKVEEVQAAPSANDGSSDDPRAESSQRSKEVHESKTNDGSLDEAQAGPSAQPDAPLNDTPAVIEERKGTIRLQIVKNDGTAESTRLLTDLAKIIDHQLPNMAMDYITELVQRQVYSSMIIIKSPHEVLGGIVYQELPNDKLAEIAFLAISEVNRRKGYGALLINNLKKHLQSTSPIQHFFTYADNLAIEFFKKQGFSTRLTLEKKLVKKLKYYRNATKMQLDLVRRSLQEELADFLKQIQNHRVSWHFDHPVNRQQFPDYYDIVASPMDLSMIDQKLHNGLYSIPVELINDLELMFSNARSYYGNNTIQVKAASSLEKFMWKLVEELPAPEWELEKDSE